VKLASHERVLMEVPVDVEQSLAQVNPKRVKLPAYRPAIEVIS